MCNDPIYRLDCTAIGVVGLLPHFLQKKIRRKGIFLDETGYKFCMSNDTLREYVQEIPCGKCYGCKVDWTSQWTARCILESMKYKSNLFVTFTYSDDYVPVKPLINPVTGELYSVMELSKKDIPAFMKRLRRLKQRQGLSSPRVFYCGEYGDRTKRPHYHMTLFDCSFDDVIPAFKKNGIQYYKSKTLTELWGLKSKGIQYGNVYFCPVTPQSIRYVAAYQMKKMRRVSDRELSLNCDYYNGRWFNAQQNQSYLVELGSQTGLVQAPFYRQSRRPGLGMSSFDELYSNYVRYDQLPKGLQLGVKYLRFMDRKIKDAYPLVWLSVKERRKRNHVPVDTPDGISIEVYRRRREELLVKKIERRSRDF